MKWDYGYDSFIFFKFFFCYEKRLQNQLDRENLKW